MKVFQRIPSAVPTRTFHLYNEEGCGRYLILKETVLKTYIELANVSCIVPKFHAVHKNELSQKMFCDCNSSFVYKSNRSENLSPMIETSQMSITTFCGLTVTPRSCIKSCIRPAIVYGPA